MTPSFLLPHLLPRNDERNPNSPPATPLSRPSWARVGPHEPAGRGGERIMCAHLQVVNAYFPESRPPVAPVTRITAASVPNQSEISPRRTPSVTASVRLLARSFSRIEAT